jgi:hypothetical protein
MNTPKTPRLDELTEIAKKLFWADGRLNEPHAAREAWLTLEVHDLALYLDLTAELLGRSINKMGAARAAWGYDTVEDHIRNCALTTVWDRLEQDEMLHKEEVRRLEAAGLRSLSEAKTM